MTLRHFTAILLKHALPISVFVTVLGIINVNPALAEERDTTPAMKLGSVRWHLKKQGVFELSADKSRLVIGDKIDSTISVVDVETGQVVRTLEQQYHKGHAQTGKFTSLIIDEHGQYIAINSYQQEVDSVGWTIVRVADGATIAERLEQFSIKALSTSRDRVVVSDANPRITPQLTIRRISDNGVVKTLGIWGWAEYEEVTGRLFVIADHVIRAYDIVSGEEIGQWGVEKSDMISKDPLSDWIYASTRISSGDKRDLNLVECVNISTNERRTFAADAFAGDCPQCLELGRLHDWSSSAEPSFLSGLLRPGQYNVMWRVNAVDSTVSLWLNPRFYLSGSPVAHDAVYLNESRTYIHMAWINLELGGIWCHDVLPNTTSSVQSMETNARVEFVNDELVIGRAGSISNGISVVVSSISGKTIYQQYYGADVQYPIRIDMKDAAQGSYICVIHYPATVSTNTFNIVR